MKIRIGSRESALAVAQTNVVIQLLKKQYPQIEIELVTLKTTGDKILSKPLVQIGGKGLFVKELDEALREGRIDLAVHSLKDVPMEENPELPLLAFPKREDARDVLVLPKGMQSSIVESKCLQEYGQTLRVGTSSIRRRLQLQALLPHAEIQSVRGNIQTRLRKLDEGEFDALILAAAGLIRAGLEDRISRYFEVQEMIPAAGQGILAVQGRADFPKEWLAGLNDEETMYTALAEREYVRFLGGGCSSPVAAYAVIKGDTLHLQGLYYQDSDNVLRKGEMIGEKSKAQELGRRLAKQMKDGD